MNDQPRTTPPKSTFSYLQFRELIRHPQDARDFILHCLMEGIYLEEFPDVNAVEGLTDLEVVNFAQQLLPVYMTVSAPTISRQVH